MKNNMKNCLIISTLLVVTSQASAQKRMSNAKKMETTEHYTFTLSDKVTRKK